MGRKSTFYEFSPATKAKWERMARRVAAIAHYDSGADSDRIWLKDEVIEHIRKILKDDGETPDDRRLGMYLERMRMASVFSGPDVPTLDLIAAKGDNNMGYIWIRDGSIPAGFLNHVLSVTSAMPRLAFDYFVLMSYDYNLDELIDAINPTKSMLLLLLAELYVRVNRTSEFDPDQLEDYLGKINQFKAEVQSRITRAESDGFNSLASGLLLTAKN